MIYTTEEYALVDAMIGAYMLRPSVSDDLRIRYEKTLDRLRCETLQSEDYSNIVKLLLLIAPLHGLYPEDKKVFSSALARTQAAFK